MEQTRNRHAGHHQRLGHWLDRSGSWIRSSGHKTFTAEQDTAVYITARSACGEVKTETKPVKVTPCARPVIHSFTAWPSIVQAGDTVTLSWHQERADALYLDGSKVTGASATRTVLKDTSFKLAAYNDCGRVQVEIPVPVRLCAKPRIYQLIPSLPTVSPGQVITLYWWALGDEVTLNGDPVDPQAAATVVVRGETQLELIASNLCGPPAVRSVVINATTTPSIAGLSSGQALLATPALRSASPSGSAPPKAADISPSPTATLSPAPASATPTGTPAPPLQASALLAREVEPLELSTAMVVGVILLLIALPCIQPRKHN